MPLGTSSMESTKLFQDADQVVETIFNPRTPNPSRIPNPNAPAFRNLLAVTSEYILSPAGGGVSPPPAVDILLVRQPNSRTGNLGTFYYGRISGSGPFGIIGVIPGNMDPNTIGFASTETSGILSVSPATISAGVTVMSGYLTTLVTELPIDFTNIVLTDMFSLGNGTCNFESSGIDKGAVALTPPLPVPPTPDAAGFNNEASGKTYYSSPLMTQSECQEVNCTSRPPPVYSGVTAPSATSQAFFATTAEALWSPGTVGRCELNIDMMVRSPNVISMLQFTVAYNVCDYNTGIVSQVNVVFTMPATSAITDGAQTAYRFTGKCLFGGTYPTATASIPEGAAYTSLTANFIDATTAPVVGWQWVEGSAASIFQNFRSILQMRSLDTSPTTVSTYILMSDVTAEQKFVVSTHINMEATVSPQYAPFCSRPQPMPDSSIFSALRFLHERNLLKFAYTEMDYRLLLTNVPTSLEIVQKAETNGHASIMAVLGQLWNSVLKKPVMGLVASAARQGADMADTYGSSTMGRATVLTRARSNSIVQSDSDDGYSYLSDLTPQEGAYLLDLALAGEDGEVGTPYPDAPSDQFLDAIKDVFPEHKPTRRTIDMRHNTGNHLSSARTIVGLGRSAIVAIPELDPESPEFMPEFPMMGRASMNEDSTEEQLLLLRDMVARGPAPPSIRPQPISDELGKATAAIRRGGLTGPEAQARLAGRTAGKGIDEFAAFGGTKAWNIAQCPIVYDSPTKKSANTVIATVLVSTLGIKKDEITDHAIRYRRYIAYDRATGNELELAVDDRFHDVDGSFARIINGELNNLLVKNVYYGEGLTVTFHGIPEAFQYTSWTAAFAVALTMLPAKDIYTGSLELRSDEFVGDIAAKTIAATNAGNKKLVIVQHVDAPREQIDRVCAVTQSEYRTMADLANPRLLGAWNSARTMITLLHSLGELVITPVIMATSATVSAREDVVDYKAYVADRAEFATKAQAVAERRTLENKNANTYEVNAAKSLTIGGVDKELSELVTEAGVTPEGNKVLQKAKAIDESIATKRGRVAQAYDGSFFVNLDRDISTGRWGSVYNKFVNAVSIINGANAKPKGTQPMQAQQRKVDLLKSLIER